MWDKLGKLYWFWQFLCDGYLPLILKDSINHMHGLGVYVKEGLPFARDLSLEKFTDSYICFRLALLHTVSYFFFLYQSPCLSLCTVFYSISSNIGEVLSINPSANVFVFGDFKGCVHYIFASLFCMSKRKCLWNNKDCFLFELESSFRSWENQILTFQILKCHDVIKCPSIKHELHFTE